MPWYNNNNPANTNQNNVLLLAVYFDGTTQTFSIHAVFLDCTVVVPSGCNLPPLEPFVILDGSETARQAIANKGLMVELATLDKGMERALLCCDIDAEDTDVLVLDEVNILLPMCFTLRGRILVVACWVTTSLSMVKATSDGVQETYSAVAASYVSSSSSVSSRTNAWTTGHPSRSIAQKDVTRTSSESSSFLKHTGYSAKDEREDRATWPARSFNASQSTEDNYKHSNQDTAKLNPFHPRKDKGDEALILNVGRFADIRKTLDYSYHSVYTLERQAFQDDLIQSILDQHEHTAAQVLRGEPTDTHSTCTSVELAYKDTTTDQSSAASGNDNTRNTTKPSISDADRQTSTLSRAKTNNTPQWIVFTAGVMGAGKIRINHHIIVQGKIGLAMQPEFHVYVQGPDPRHSELAGERTRKEANLLTEVLTKAALGQGRSVVVDGTLRDATWYQTYFAQLRKDYPGVAIAILHITAPPQAVYQRAEVR